MDISFPEICAQSRTWPAMPLAARFIFTSWREKCNEKDAIIHIYTDAVSALQWGLFLM
jgi:hypothetical protein